MKNDNPADVSQIREGVGGPPRVAETEVCDAHQCQVGQLLVRGDHVSFISLEQFRLRGGGLSKEDRRRPSLLPSDIPIPRGFVLVHDTAGAVLRKCDFYVVRWYSSRADPTTKMAPNELRAARDYFGGRAKIKGGSIDIPDGPWKRAGRIQSIRYRRPGFQNLFQHDYDVPVDLWMTNNPLAWRIALPDGCVVDSRGFVSP